jgi:hypothetical protein
MPITSAFTNSAKQEVLNGVHLPGHTYKMALYTSAATLGKTTTAYSTTNEVVGQGYSAGGVALTGRTVVPEGDTVILTFNNASWANSTITARGCEIYNDTVAGKPVLAVYDFGEDVSSTNGTFTAPIPAVTAEAGLIRIT